MTESENRRRGWRAFVPGPVNRLGSRVLVRLAQPALRREVTPQLEAHAAHLRALDEQCRSAPPPPPATLDGEQLMTMLSPAFRALAERCEQLEEALQTLRPGDVVASVREVERLSQRVAELEAVIARLGGAPPAATQGKDAGR